jgi:ATP-dependent DNA helicase RecG
MNVSALEGIGSSRSKLLNDMGIFTVMDLVNHFPRDYDDRSEIKTISMLSPGAANTIRGVIVSEGENVVFKPGSPVLTKFILKDETGVLELVWFGQPYLKQYFKKNQEYLFTGKVKETFGRLYRLQMESPAAEHFLGNAFGQGIYGYDASCGE